MFAMPAFCCAQTFETNPQSKKTAVKDTKKPKTMKTDATVGTPVQPTMPNQKTSLPQTGKPNGKTVQKKDDRKVLTPAGKTAGSNMKDVK